MEEVDEEEYDLEKEDFYYQVGSIASLDYGSFFRKSNQDLFYETGKELIEKGFSEKYALDILDDIDSAATKFVRCRDALIKRGFSIEESSSVLSSLYNASIDDMDYKTELIRNGEWI